MKQVTPYQTEESKKQQVESMFDNIADNYDRLNRVLSLKIDILWRKRLVQMIKAEQPSQVLDIATGTGDLAIAIHEGTGAKVTGLDLSQGMLNVADEKLKKLGLASEITMQKGDAENLPFGDNSFDAVTAAFGVRNFENLETGLKEMLRVTKQGKSVYILEFSKVEGLLGPAYMFYFKHILPQIGKLVSKDNRAYTYLPDSVNVFPYGEKMKQILLNCGFKTVTYQKLSFGIATIYKAIK